MTPREPAVWRALRLTPLLLAACLDFDPAHDGFPCDGSACDCSLSDCVPPAASCLDGQTLATYEAQSCSPECTFRKLETACGGGCTGGRCLDDRCAGVACGAPPPAECDGDVSRTFSEPGSCDSSSGLCQYAKVETTCAMGCAAGACLTGVSIETIHTKRFKPNLWLLVDRSGSMISNDICTSDGGADGGCVTRLEALKNAMHFFLSQHGDVARMALAAFPQSAANQCSAASAIMVDLPSPTTGDKGTGSTLVAQAQEIDTAITTLSAMGGTPTGASVSFVGAQPGLRDPNDGRGDFILLLTDGLPNCNKENPNNLCGCAAGTCTPQQVSQCNCAATTCGGAYCSLGCLDQDGTVAQLSAQRAGGVRTIVVAFGPDLRGSASVSTLEAMAASGGARLRRCPGGTAAECGIDDSCVQATHLCQRQYFKADDAAELADRLGQISSTIGQGSCTVSPLATVDSQSLVGLLVDGVNVAPGAASWRLIDGTIVFADSSSYCLGIQSGQDLVLTLRYRP